MYEAIGLFLFFCTAISQHRLQYSKHQRPQSLEPFQAMPYAKVGALPQSTDVGRMQHHQRGKGRGKPKAMSMEVRAKKIEGFLKFFNIYAEMRFYLHHTELCLFFLPNFN